MYIHRKKNVLIFLFLNKLLFFGSKKKEDRLFIMRYTLVLSA